MEQGYSVGNIFKNLSAKQKLGFVALAVVIVVLGVVLMVVAQSGDSGELVNGGGDDILNGTYTNEQGNTVKVETEKDRNGNTVTTKTSEDDEGNVTTTKIVTDKDGNKTTTEVVVDEYGNERTTDPKLLTTYFPYQVMRKHDNYEPTLRYFVDVNEEEKIIEAIVEACDEEEDKKLVKQYVDSVPLDLSAYVVNYELASEDAICDVRAELGE